MTILRTLIPSPILSLYHFAWATGAAWWYGYPSRTLTVIGITGTKGKSSVSEMVAAILREEGHTVAVASTIHFVIGEETERNLYKMTMPGRGRLQKFMRDAAKAGCTHAVIEMTSEGVLQHRHAGIDLDALVFTNLTPEHIERHGSFERYAEAKLELARALARSPKRPRTIVANQDDAYGTKFLATEADVRAPYSLNDAKPYSADETGARFVWQGELFSVPLPGLFNVKNCLAALTLGNALGIDTLVMKRALEHLPPIAGRAERIEQGQPFAVVVDYAHTPESLEALYETYASLSNTGTRRRLICVVGATGGGRDKAKRARMGAMADTYCDAAFLTDDDPYDENSESILADLAKGFANHVPTRIVDRRNAIAAALAEAKDGDAVLITGKGTDPYLMLAHGKKMPWSDRDVATEELTKLGYN